MRLTNLMGVVAGGLVLAGVGAGVAMTAAPGSASAERAELRRADVMLVKVHADWCGHCARLTPHWEQAMESRLGDQNVLFVKLDITNPQTKGHSEMLANELGLAKIWEERSSRTGQMFIVDRESKKILADFNSSTSGDEIASALDKALK